MVSATQIAPIVLHFFIIFTVTIGSAGNNSGSFIRNLFTKQPQLRGSACYAQDSCTIGQNKQFALPAEYFAPKKPVVPVFASARRTRVEPIQPEQSDAQPQNIQNEGGSLDPNRIHDLINQERTNRGLNPLHKNEEVCKVAEARTDELAGEIASGNLHAGLYNKDIPFRVTENMKYGGNEESAVRWWLNSPVHRQAMLGNYEYTCGTCSGNTCAQLFSNLSPK